MKLILVALSVLACCVDTRHKVRKQNFPLVNETPVIGIVAIPPEDESAEYSSFFKASYVKYLEMEGARVIPIFYDDSQEQMKKKLRLLNGVLLTGGKTEITFPDSNLLTPFGEAVRTILKHSQLEMEAGRYFPVWGTCQGYEAISIVMTNNTKVLGKSNAISVNLPINFTDEAQTSRLFSNLDPTLGAAVSSMPLTFHHHEYGIPVSYFNNDFLGMNEIFNLLGTTLDSDNIPIVSVIEHKTLPIYGVAFHPEKPIFEFFPDYNIPHSKEARDFARYLAQFFVSEAKRNELSISYQDTIEMKVQNYPLVFPETYTGQFYCFK